MLNEREARLDDKPLNANGNGGPERWGSFSLLSSHHLYSCRRRKILVLMLRFLIVFGFSNFNFNYRIAYASKFLIQRLFRLQNFITLTVYFKSCALLRFTEKEPLRIPNRIEVKIMRNSDQNFDAFFPLKYTIASRTNPP